MKMFYYVAILSSFVQPAFSGNFLPSPPPFSDSTIFKNASVIKNEETIVFEITDIDRCTYTVHQVLTILNEKGKNELDFEQYSNKYISLEDAEIKVYDSKGMLAHTFRKKDMTKVSYGEGLIDDGNLTYFRVPAPGYPIIVEYNYQLKFKGTVNYPSYNIMSSGEAVMKSTFIARVPKELDLRYKEKNIQLKPVVTEDATYKQYQWSVSDMKALAYEEGTATYKSRYPSIQLAPNRFSYYGNEGDLTSWKKFGEWIGNLYEGKDELPQDRKIFFNDMVKRVSTDRLKAEIIYDYLQKNFRYVSIQLGIGGLKPFPAVFTDEKKYGDCKGLSIYMKAALKAVGIKSYIAIINAEYNREPVDPGFPENDFNHAIVCIPEPKDSIWLECTSSNADFGVLGSFTENRNALLITEKGGVLVPTPVSKSNENILSAKTFTVLAEDGSGTSVTSLISSGSFKEELEDNLLQGKRDDQKEFLVRDYGFKQPDEFEINKNVDSGKFSITIKMAMERIPVFTAGNKMFIAPRLYKQWQEKLPEAENRRLDFYFANPFIKTDTTIFKLPEEYTTDALPSPKNFNCEYGNYTTSFFFEADKNSIVSTSRLELTQLKIPASKYPSVKNFFDKIMHEDSEMIVIRKMD